MVCCHFIYNNTSYFCKIIFKNDMTIDYLGRTLNSDLVVLNMHFCGYRQDTSSSQGIYVNDVNIIQVRNNVCKFTQSSSARNNP